MSACKGLSRAGVTGPLGADGPAEQAPAVRLDELDVICAVLGCEVGELLLPEPGKVPQPAPEDAARPAAVADARPVTPRSRGGRSLPPR